MKDPIQPGATPYEVLGVSRAASAEQLDGAYKARFVAGKGLAQLRAAHLALQDPVERAAIDAFLYDSAALRRLVPDVTANADLLTRPRRGETVRQWRDALQRNFPDVSILHCLCVAWYWAARMPASPDSANDEEWRLATAGWAAYLAAAPGWLQTTDDDREQVVARIAGRLRNDLQDHEQSQRGLGRTADADRLREINRAFDAELAVARDVAAVGYRLPRGELTCGPALLELLGLGQTVAADLQRRERETPGDPRVPRVRRLLSPLGRAEWLLAHGEAEAALALLDAAAPDDRASDTAQRIRDAAWLMIGRRHADAGRASEALRMFAAVLEAGWPQAAADAAAAIVNACNTAAREWGGSRRDDAIAVLEQGLALIDDLQIGHVLAELLAADANQRLTAALEGVDLQREPAPARTIAPLGVALAKFQRAADLGSTRSEAQARYVRGLINEYHLLQRPTGTMAFNDLPPAARTRLVDALRGSGVPAPLIRDVAKPRFPALAVAAASAVALLVVALSGFGGPGAFAYQGVGFVPVYGALLFGMFASGADLVYGRSIGNWLPYRPGRYVLPLTLVEADTAAVVVRPLRAAKMEWIDHHNAGRYTHTVFSFTFPDGTMSAFNVKPKAEADRVSEALSAARNAENDVVRGVALAALQPLDPFLEVA